MQAANRLQQGLRSQRGLSFGAWQMLPGANHARFMARSGYDWICVDTEHGNIAGMYFVKLIPSLENMPDTSTHSESRLADARSRGCDCGHRSESDSAYCRK